MIFGFFTAYGLLNVAQQHLVYAMNRGSTTSWWTSILLQMPVAYTWALATPGIQWLARRFPLERGSLVRSILVHLVAGFTFVFLLDLAYAFHITLVIPAAAASPSPLVRRAWGLFVYWIFSDGLLYWMIVAVTNVAEHRRRLQEREVAASQLRTQLAQAELRALKMQLHPHFLFNALHTIGSLVRTGDRDSAVKILAGLGDLLRRILDDGAQQEVPLAHELEFVRNYLDIEQARFRDRLEVAINVQPDALEAWVPHLILQPLVENAIRHGIAPYTWAGHLLVEARRLGGRLELLVRDDGPGLEDEKTEASRPGIGLANTRARLERLYEGDYHLDVRNAASGGLEVRLDVPFRAAIVTEAAT
jgi:signal transduction histidine kinase